MTKHLLDADCIENRHAQCPGCGCICHWDAVLVRHFTNLGRRTDNTLVNPRPHARYVAAKRDRIDK